MKITEHLHKVKSFNSGSRHLAQHLTYIIPYTALYYLVRHKLLTFPFHRCGN